MKLKILDLFSGLGGFSLGLERTGNFETIAFCDNDKYSNLVLQKHWKGVKIYNDVKEITKERLEADGIQSPDIITGGFPCQPFSVAGKQKGTSDDRHLWPEMFRIIKEFTPRWVIGENVKGLVNLQDGMVFETVCTDLEGEGYEVRAFNIPAAGVGAPHRRERIWIVANSRRTLQQRTELREKNEDEVRKGYANQHQRSSGTSESDVANANESISRERQISRNLSDEGRRTSKARGESLQSEDRQTRTDNIRSSSEDVANAKGEGTRENDEGLWSRTSGISRGQRTSGTEEDVANANINGTKRNQPEDRQRSRTQQSGEDVANTYARLSDGTYEEVQSRGQTFDTSSEGTRKDVADTESSDRHDNETLTRDGESQTQEIFGDGSSLSGESSWWHTEPDVGRVAHGVSGRVYRLKGLGNSIVPKIAEEIGKAIMEAEADDIEYQGGGAYKAMLKLFNENLK